MTNNEMYEKICDSKNLNEQKELVNKITDEEILFSIATSTDDNVYFWIKPIAAQKITNEDKLRQIMKDKIVSFDIKRIALMKLSLSRYSDDYDYYIFGTMSWREQAKIVEEISDEQVLYKIVQTNGVSRFVKEDAIKKLENVNLVKEIIMDTHTDDTIRALCIDKINEEEILKQLLETDLRSVYLKEYLIRRLKDLDYLMEIVKNTYSWSLKTGAVQRIMKLYPSEGRKRLIALNDGMVSMQIGYYPPY